MTTRRITSRAGLAFCVLALLAGAALGQGWAGGDDAPETPDPPAGELEQTEAPPSQLEAYEEGLPDDPADRKIAQANRINEEPGANADDEAGGGFWYSVLQSLGALLLVLGLIYLLTWLLRRFGRRSPLLAGAHYGRVIGRLFLTQRSSLHFVRTGGRVLVIGVGPQSVTLVTEFDEAAFADALGDALEEEGEPSGTPEETGVTRFVDALRRRMAGTDDPEPYGETPSHAPRRRDDAFADAEPSGSAAAREPERRDADNGMADEIASLRGDIQRLQAFLRDSSAGEQR
jgi:flagellar biosynthetic protein FliO